MIDDITWNDLDLDSVFMMMNHTWSAIGESSLYDMLRRPQFSEEVLNERERLIRFFQTHEAERERFLELCAEIGKTGRYSVFDYIYNLAEMKMETLFEYFAYNYSDRTYFYTASGRDSVAYFYDFCEHGTVLWGKKEN